MEEGKEMNELLKSINVKDQEDMLKLIKRQSYEIPQDPKGIIHLSGYLDDFDDNNNQNQ